MAGWTIDDRLDTPANADLMRYLRREHPSAHSDVAEALTAAAAGVAGVQTYCPDRDAYAFVALHLEDFTVIGPAFGMSGLALLIPEAARGDALRDGGAHAPDLGPGWVRFEPWGEAEALAESRARLARWCAVAAGARMP